MSDTADYWRDVNAFRKEQRARRRGHMPQAVHAVRCAVAGIDGAKLQQFTHEHYRVLLPGGAWVDYWPGTGTWRSKDGKRRGSGVKTLLKEAQSCIAR